MTNSLKTSLAASAAIGALVAAGAAVPAMAQETRETITVTASKRAQAIQDVPFSVNAQTQADFERTGAKTLEDVARNVAGLAIQNLGPGQSQVAIRGVSAGQIIRDQPGVKEQVGIYLDESVISLSLFTPDLDLYDLNRVETLRGPQGTLFGSGSVGGTIRYITNQPDMDSQSASAEADINTVADGGVGGHLKGMVNMPLSGKASLRVVGYHTEYAGYIDALREGGGRTEDVNSGQRTGVRAALRLEPTATVAVTPRIVYQKAQADGFNRQEVYNLFANPFTTTRPAIQLGEREQFLQLDERFEDETLVADVMAEIGTALGDVTSITSYTDREILVSRDASALTGSVSDDFGITEAGILTPSNLRDTTDLKQFTQEIRLSSSGDGPWQWLVGAFYADTERTYAQRLPTPGYDAFADAALGAGTSAGAANGFGPDSPYNADLPYDLTQIAVFGEASYDVNERLTVTAGGRFYDFEEERRFTSGGVFSGSDDQVDSTTSDGFTPRVLANYDLNDDVTLNAQVSQGFRLGGVNDPLNVPLCSPADEAIFGGFQDYDDETLVNYEAGVKVDRGNFRMNAAAFYTDIEDLQVTLDAGTCSSRVVFNVPEAHTAGVEFEMSANPTPNLEVSFAGSLLESEFDSSVVDGTGAVLGGIEEGNRLPSVPDLQLAVAGTYSFPADWARPGATGFVSGSIQHIGDRITQPGDQVPGAGVFGHRWTFGGAPGTDSTTVNLELPSYELVNINAGLDFGDWQVVGYINNVTDENVLYSFDRERGGQARLAFRTNTPRQIGFTVRKAY